MMTAALPASVHVGFVEADERISLIRTVDADIVDNWCLKVVAAKRRRCLWSLASQKGAPSSNLVEA
jgi:hypothetical protein